MLSEYRIPVGTEDAQLLEEAGEEMGGWFLFRDAMEGRDYLTGYFEREIDAETSLEALSAVLPVPISIANARVTPVEDRDWKEAYKEHFKAWRCGGLHWVPVWERDGYSVPEGEKVIWLDPGMAFGTGNHETTRLCVERMIAFCEKSRRTGRDISRMSLLDVGSGSGILALSAARLGFGKVTGFDNDAEAVAISRENATGNDLPERVDFFVGGLPEGLHGRSADLVLANIQSDVLMRHADDLLAAAKPGGALVMSGILAAEVVRVREHFEERAPERRVESRVLGEWADLAIGREE